ncbi:MAG: putative quinol monooxygenase [Acidobacteriota bacterium]
MYIIQVFVQVKPEHLDAFKAVTVENASNSQKEAGVVRFDMLQQLDDPTRFTLIEVYRSADGHASHRETAHYAKWRDTVPDMLAEPRTAVKYQNICPDDQGW